MMSTGSSSNGAPGPEKLAPVQASMLACCCLLLQDLYKSCARGGGVKRGDVCYGMLRAAACVDESDHHALMYVRHGQTVREEGVDE